MFKIEILKKYWINGEADDAGDLCLHGDVLVRIGEQCLGDTNVTISATGLYLLRSLENNHLIGNEEHMLPCCGHAMYANKTLDTVEIIGCPNGVDWSIVHDGGKVKFMTESGYVSEVIVTEYRGAVMKVVSEVESFYQVSSDKILPDNELDRQGYLAFWNEWIRRRRQYVRSE